MLLAVWLPIVGLATIVGLGLCDLLRECATVGILLGSAK